MEEFNVELVGGPFPGRRSLRTPRAEPPHQIPIVQREPARAIDDSPAARPQQPVTRRIALYRYSCRHPDGRFVYHFAGERRT